MDWTNKLPQEPGDYLWVNMFGCDCCVSESGIAFIYNVIEYGTQNKKAPLYRNDTGDLMGISWEGQPPKSTVEKHGVTTYFVESWAKITLPKSNDNSKGIKEGMNE